MTKKDINERLDRDFDSNFESALAYINENDSAYIRTEYVSPSAIIKQYKKHINDCHITVWENGIVLSSITNKTNAPISDVVDGIVFSTLPSEVKVYHLLVHIKESIESLGSIKYEYINQENFIIDELEAVLGEIFNVSRKTQDNTPYGNLAINKLYITPKR